MTNTEIKQSLETIVNIFQDSIKGYQKAADNVDNTEIKTLFLKISKERKQAIADLEQDARDFGITLEADGTLKGYFHRVWMDISTTFATKEALNVVEESMFGEQEALSVYNEVLDPKNKVHLPAYIRKRLLNQRLDILYSYAKLAALEATLDKDER